MLGTWNVKIKMKEVGIKFQKEAEKFLEIDIRLLNVFKKTHFAHRNTRCDQHKCKKTRFYLKINFNLMKIYYFPMFS